MKALQKRAYRNLEIKKQSVKNFHSAHLVKKESSVLGNEQFVLGKIILLLFFTMTIFSCSKDDEPQAQLVISEAITRTDFNLNDNTIAQKGKNITIKVINFNPEENEYMVTLGGSVCENIGFGNGFIVIKVPNDAIAGDLVMTAGTQSVTWSEPIRLVDPPVINAFIEDDNTLIKLVRDSDTYKEIGTVFTPLVNGTIVALGAKGKARDSKRLTLWDGLTSTNLTSLVIVPGNNQTGYGKLETPIRVKAGQKYMISIFSNNWCIYVHIPVDNIYPKTVNKNIKLEYLAESDDYDNPDGNADFNFPNKEVETDISLGADFVFVPDIE